MTTGIGSHDHLWTTELYILHPKTDSVPNGLNPMGSVAAMLLWLGPSRSGQRTFGFIHVPAVHTSLPAFFRGKWSHL